MSSTFKNRVPKRKYRERVQPAGREELGLLPKKKDYKERAENFHKKEDMINQLKLKASTKNEDEFYFKMLKGKKTEDGRHLEESDDDSEFNEREFRAALKTENYSIVNVQRSIVKKKIDKLRASLQLITQEKQNKHKIFVNDEQEFQNFEPHQHFHTTKELVAEGFLEVDPKSLARHQISLDPSNANLREKYNKLTELLKKEGTLTKLLLKLAYEKNLLGKERKMIKKSKQTGKKVHKFFMERKK